MVVHKIAIPVVSPEGLLAPIEYKFGRCNIFTIIIQEDSIINQVRVEFLERIRTAGGSSFQVSNFIMKFGITELFIGKIGPNAYYALTGIKNLKIYQIPWEGVETVKNTLELFNMGKLTQFSGNLFTSPPGRRYRHGRQRDLN